MNCNDVRELLEDYSLGLLDSDQQAVVNAHLETCMECRELAQIYADIIATLPLALNAAAPAQPPQTIKARLLEAVQKPSPASSTPTPSVAARPELPRLFIRRRALLLFAALLLAVLLVGLGTGLSVALARESALQTQIANLTDQQALVLDVVDSPKVSKLLLRPPTGTTSTAYGKVYTRPDLNDVVVMIARLPVPTAGQSYHVWLTDSGQVHLAGMLTVNAEGFGLLTFKADKLGPVYQSAQITLQAVGTDTLSGPAILLSNAPQ